MYDPFPQNGRHSLLLNLQTFTIKIHVGVAAVACKGATVHPAADAVLRLDPPDAGGPHPPPLRTRSNNIELGSV